MRIYEIGTGYTPIPAKISAATEIVAAELAEAMARQGHDVRIIDIGSPDRGPITLPLEEVPVPKALSATDLSLSLMHKLRRVAYSLSLTRTLRRILEETDEKVVFHFHNQYNLFFFLTLVPEKLRRRCLIAYTNHSGIWRLDWGEIRSIIRKRYFQEVQCLKQADLVFLLNEQTRKNLTEHLNIPAEKLICVENGVNIDTYAPLTGAEKRAAMGKWGFAGKTVILQVGSVNENKGQLRAARSLQPLLKAHPELVYAYAGGIVSEEYHRQVRDFAREKGISNQVRYLGMVPPGAQLRGLYGAAAATIVHSHYEGFCLAVIESCACGIPVLHRKDGPVSLSGGGIGFDDDDLTAIAEEIILKQSEDYERLCSAARQAALERYSWDKIAGAYLSNFRRALP